MTELPSSRFQASTDNPTVIELFQSQGCSSCPPANANVIRLAQDPKYLLLTYEVTYWDRLGWKDTLGSSESDNRQWEYANALGHKSVFTPQVVVNGSVDGVGNNSNELDTMIAKASQPRHPGISIEHVVGGILVSGPDHGTGTVQLISYNTNQIDVTILKGENEGLCLPHQNVVHDVTVLGTWSGGVQTFSLHNRADDALGKAILIHRKPGGPIIAAARII